MKATANIILIKGGSRILLKHAFTFPCGDQEHNRQNILRIECDDITCNGRIKVLVWFQADVDGGDKMFGTSISGPVMECNTKEEGIYVSQPTII